MSSETCNHCGAPLENGMWPWCPHGYLPGFRRSLHDKKAVYYRDEGGTICIPPDPGMVPAGYTAITVESIREAEKLSKEVAADYYNRFQDHGAFTTSMEDALGDPRRRLLDRMGVTGSNLERDVIRELVKDMDKEASARQNIRSDAHFKFLE